MNGYIKPVLVLGAFAGIIYYAVTTYTHEQAAAGGHGTARYENLKFPFQNIFGTYDRAALQRGYQVYQEVCAACHGLNLVAYRNLTEIGFTADQVKAVAAQYQVPGGPDANGDLTERPALPSDRFKSPYPNAEAAKAANGGAVPPDLSLITKARAGGADYIYALLTGYEEPPADATPPSPTLNYNPHFQKGPWIAMPPPLAEGSVTYADNTSATIPQMSYDVASFLNWAAEPELETRHRTGLKAILFLLVLTGIMYAAKRKLWVKVHNPQD